MLSKEITKIIQRYPEINNQHINQIDADIKDIIEQLYDFRDILVNMLKEILCDNQIDYGLYNDIKLLNMEINKIKILQLAPFNNSYNKKRQVLLKTTPHKFKKYINIYISQHKICPFCNIETSLYIIHYIEILFNKHLRKCDMGVNKCKKCEKLFITSEKAEAFENGTIFSDTNIILHKEESYEIPQIDIYSVLVLSNTLNCSTNHNTRDLIVKIPVLNEQCNLVYKNINALYCFNCKRFTILRSDFVSIKGVVMCNVIDETNIYTNAQKNTNGLNKQSKINQYGYNVQAKKNLSKKQRQIILSSIIEANIMNRMDIISFINYLIDTNKNKPKLNNAIRKWTEDKKFVAEYKDGYLPSVFVDDLILKYKKSKNDDDENIY